MPIPQCPHPLDGRHGHDRSAHVYDRRIRHSAHDCAHVHDPFHVCAYAYESYHHVYAHACAQTRHTRIHSAYALHWLRASTSLLFIKKTQKDALSVIFLTLFINIIPHGGIFSK